MVPVKNIAAIILAAGFSSRMGSFKPLLPLGKTTVIERSVAVFKQAGINDITVVIGHRAGELLPVLTSLGVNVVINSSYEKGMFSSVKTGVTSIKPQVKAFFFLPGDIPLVTPATVLALLETYQKRPTGILYPCFRGERGHPPLVSTAYKEIILTWNREGGLRAILQEFEEDAADIEVADQGVLQDMDTPEDYLKVRESLYNTFPSWQECLRMHETMGVSSWVTRHCQVVAQVAGKITIFLAESGYVLNHGLILAAALLHDIARDKKDHALTGANLLRQLGYPGVADIVANHMDIQDKYIGVNEVSLVYLADKLVKEDQVVSLEQRLGEMNQRYNADNAVLETVTNRFANAQKIKKKIEQIISQPLEKIIL